MLQILNRRKSLSAFLWHCTLSAPLWLLGGMLATSAAWAQGSYSSGSSGADGAFNPTTDITTIQLPESGVFNYTTVIIPTNVTVRFTRNSRNTPVTILATGNVIINGTIDVSGTSNNNFLGGSGGPGGFDGGRGGASNQDGVNGSGPGGGGGGRVNSSNGSAGGGGGGGFATAGGAGNLLIGSDQGLTGFGGSIYGFTSLVPLIGGSGGGGRPGFNGGPGGSGGGGGGAILIASSAEISGSGFIRANGGVGIGGGSGSGGAIRLAANSLKGSLNLLVTGTSGGGGNVNGGAGYIRLEAVDTVGFSPSISPQNAVVSSAPPQPAIQTNAPQLRIVSVAGVNAPNYLSGSFNGPDIILPSTQTGAVTVALAGNNVPLVTQLQVVVVPQNGTATTVQASALTGTQASSTATASVTLPAGPSLIYATAVVDLTLISYLAPIYLDGERVRKMEIGATFGSKSEVTYITESGKRIKRTGE
jgi:hypothetical protein